MDQETKAKISWWTHEYCKGNVRVGGNPKNVFIILVLYELKQPRDAKHWVKQCP